MSLLRPTRLSLLAILLCATVSASATPLFPPEEANKLLPSVIGEFKATAPGSAFEVSMENELREFNAISAANRMYKSRRGEAIVVSMVLTRSDSSAYALLTSGTDVVGSKNGTLVGLETSSTVSPAMVRFARGRAYVVVQTRKNDPQAPEALKNLSQLLADSLDKGEGDIPAVVKHLPGWENGDLHSQYAISVPMLKANVPNQPIFDSISFEGGVAAASANYGAAQLVIVEFNTPQLATDNNERIVARIQELRTQGQPTPTGYRRVGNYAVFVFNGTDEQAANQLIDQVKYQQVVQWLGENPFSLEKATREFTETTLGVLVSVVKTSGLALLACLAVGGFAGALLFRVRRSQQRAREAYADSDAMLRLNLDELTPETDPRRLLERRN
ncbi:MAG TPA: DUF6599 family protein [Pyrinomonadaceae bacterium]|nr:DUF6599 family protein [Pyrinomonadaceae bacterium]